MMFLRPTPKIPPRWTESPDGRCNLIDSAGRTLGYIFRDEDSLWMAVYDNVRVGRFLSKASAMIGVANARGRVLMPGRVIASEEIRERLGRRMRVERL